MPKKTAQNSTCSGTKKMLRILRITKLSTVSIVSANKFTWVDKEAAILIERAYRRHLVENPPKISTKELEKLEAPVHFKPVDYTDKFLYASMRLMRVFTHAFFRKSYNHHAVCFFNIRLFLKRLQQFLGLLVQLQDTCVVYEI